MDDIRAWYGDMQAQQLDSKCPLQWAIFADNYLPNEPILASIDEEIINLVSSSHTTAVPTPTMKTSTMHENIAALILQGLRPLPVTHSPHRHSHPSSVESTVQLAQDLLLASESGCDMPTSEMSTQGGGHAPPTINGASSTRSLPSRIQLSSMSDHSKAGQFNSAAPSSTHTATPLVSPADATSTAASATGVVHKRNPFISAKEQFSQEKRSRQQQCDHDKEALPESLQHFDRHMLEKLESEILPERSAANAVTFLDIAGLDFAKKCVQELICWPMLRPDIFTGLRALPKGVLLFGPPGTGKTLIGKAIAQQTGSTFFSISASSLTSKWVGESETAVRALFALAVHHQPSVVFIDEVDSLLTQRSSEESEASRRIKTEFLVQLDGASTASDAKVVVIGATNRPDELDEAARRRFVKRLYIPLPDRSGREQLVRRLLLQDENSVVRCNLAENDIQQIVEKTEGFSGADIRFLCTEAAMGPVREIASCSKDLNHIVATEVPPISSRHFDDALTMLSASVSSEDLDKYIAWNSTFGTYRRME